MTERDEIRATYDAIAEKYRQKRADPLQCPWNDLLETPAMLELVERHVKRGTKALDLGCGTGLLTKELHDRGATPVGIDLSERMISFARMDFPHLEFFVARADRMPFGDQEFDLVASSLVVHYVKDLNPLFSEVSRVLRPDGHFVFSMHHPFEMISRECKDGVFKPVAAPYFNNDPYYWRMCDAQILSFHHTFEDIVRGLARAGFQVTDLRECRPDPSVKDSFKDYEYTSQFPTFCVFDSVKNGPE